MQAYGHSRRDKLTCKYGCCTGKSGKERSYRCQRDRIRRKTARQLARKMWYNTDQEQGSEVVSKQS